MFKTGFLLTKRFLTKPHLQNQLQSFRSYATRKRFYKSTGILHSGGKFEVTLDQRKLKTPKGNLLLIDSKPLALAVASEWDAQHEKIDQTSMHLTTICNTVIDNPNNLTKFDIAQYMCDYMDTDTILFQTCENDDLYTLQIKEWDPVIKWFTDRFQVDLEKCREMAGFVIKEEVKTVLRKYLLSYNFDSLNGFVYGVDTLKSVLLTLACIERFISVEKAVYLSRLEEEFQLRYWGRVEWAHDLEQQDLQARLSAVVLFVYFNTSSTQIQNKNEIAQ